MGIGVATYKPVIGAVSKCAIPGPPRPGRDCTASDPMTPAVRAGLKPGDRILSYDGTKIKSYERLQELIRASGRPYGLDGRAPRRPGPHAHRPGDHQPDAVAGPIPTRRSRSASWASPRPAGRERQGPGTVVSAMSDLTTRTVGSLLNMPKKMVGVWNAAFSDKKRDPNGPDRRGSARAASAARSRPPTSPGLDKLAFFLMMLGTVNFAIRHVQPGAAACRSTAVTSRARCGRA